MYVIVSRISPGAPSRASVVPSLFSILHSQSRFATLHIRPTAYLAHKTTNTYLHSYAARSLQRELHLCFYRAPCSAIIPPLRYPKFCNAHVAVDEQPRPDGYVQQHGFI